ncbi:MAG: glutamate formimidoyltransferase [Deltaproteobacteria bacterium]|nr:glutamate formimidoyltransferase [Deltaproteobacteria bacterium]
MAKLVECVPNFSEGRRPEVIEAIVEPLRKKKGCWLVDYRADQDHNRLVATVVGAPAAVEDAVLEAARVAIAKIDLESHSGGHPRIGAVDVIPFVPLRNISMEECVSRSRSFGSRYYEETGVPVYFYEEAALRPDRRKLETIRKGQYEALKAEVSKPERQPDVGEARLHATAGATVIGARKFLVAFNVNLATPDVEVARRIAGAVKAASGGLGHVKAIGLSLEKRGLVQVSMNIVDYEKNALYRVLELVRMEARRWGVAVVETEVYGMVPAAALLDSASYYMQLAGFSVDQVLELRLLEMLGNEET